MIPANQRNFCIAEAHLVKNIIVRIVRIWRPAAAFLYINNLHLHRKFIRKLPVNEASKSEPDFIKARIPISINLRSGNSSNDARIETFLCPHIEMHCKQEKARH